MEKEVEYIVRKACREDCFAICSMIKKLGTYKQIGDQIKITAEMLESDGFANDKEPYFHAVVAESIKTKELIGYAIYYFIYSTWKGRIGVMEDIFVEEEWRNKGADSQLIKAVCAAVLEKGCKQCRFATFVSNKEAMNLNKSLGALNLREFEDWMMLRFDEEAMKKMNT